MKVREAYAAVFPAGDVLHEGPSFAYVVREIEATGIFQLLTQPCPKARFAPPEVKLVVSEHRCPFTAQKTNFRFLAPRAPPLPPEQC